MSIARCLFERCVPFNFANSIYYQPMIDAIASIGCGYKRASYYSLRGTLLHDMKNEVKVLVDSYRSTWAEIGCTIMGNGWKDSASRSLINFLMYSPKGICFIKSVDASHFVTDAQTLCNLFVEIIEIAGANNVVHTVTNNGSNYKAVEEDVSEMKEFNVNGSSLTLGLFAGVTNSRELLDSIQAGTLKPEMALLNASLIPDEFPLLAAAHKALIAKSRESLTTHTLHSELVYNYSASKHITESLKRCGISEKTTYILAARFGASDDEIKGIVELIKGEEIDLREMENKADHAQIQKHYKITSQELAVSSLSNAITCRIAVRDAL